VLDEFTRESLTIEVSRSIKAKDVMAVLGYLFLIRGIPGFIKLCQKTHKLACGMNGSLESRGF